MSVEETITRLWYKKKLSPWLWGLLPFSFLMKKVARFRSRYYRQSKKKIKLPVPVVVVGNITAGGTGKTPMVIALTCHLKERGWHPAIVSRGYGARHKEFPHKIKPDDDPAMVGDEPVMLARETGVSVITDPNRARAARWLIDHERCDIIISDDGLQHYRLDRTIEIAVLDGQRGLGNGYCIPAGPLREPSARLQSVSLVVSKGILHERMDIKVHTMNIHTEKVVNLSTGVTLPLSRLLLENRSIHAVAGIGNPVPFFESLKTGQAHVVEHRFPDHHAFRSADLNFHDDCPVVMTAKDAVKCRCFADKRMWVLPVKGRLDKTFWQEFDTLLERLPEFGNRL